MPTPVWIVVANGSRARVLQRNGQGEPLVELRDWVHPATRQHRQDLQGVVRQADRGHVGIHAVLDGVQCVRRALPVRDRTVTLP